MSQQFNQDAVQVTAISIIAATETQAVLGNFLNPPYGGCKAVVSAFVMLTVGTGITSVSVRIRRNPNSENVVVGGPAGVTVVAGNVVLLPVILTDIIPDGRPVQYQVTVQQAGGAGNGTANIATVDATLISG
ncbi:MAG: hypothetical protein ACRDRL_22835 [Sciscionella sp.]